MRIMNYYALKVELELKQECSGMVTQEDGIIYPVLFPGKGMHRASFNSSLL